HDRLESRRRAAFLFWAYATAARIVIGLWRARGSASAVRKGGVCQLLSYQGGQDETPNDRCLAGRCRGQAQTARSVESTGEAGNLGAIARGGARPPAFDAA